MKLVAWKDVCMLAKERGMQVLAEFELDSLLRPDLPLVFNHMMRWKVNGFVDDDGTASPPGWIHLGFTHSAALKRLDQVDDLVDTEGGLATVEELEFLLLCSDGWFYRVKSRGTCNPWELYSALIEGVEKSLGCSNRYRAFSGPAVSCEKTSGTRRKEGT